MALNVWEAVVPTIALAGTTGTLIGVWWKVSSENELRKKDLAAHDVRIGSLERDKAENVDLVKLAELVGKMAGQVESHHIDNVRHRTPDFELRLENFYRGVEQFMAENRGEHKEILEQIRGMK